MVMTVNAIKHSTYEINILKYNVVNTKRLIFTVIPLEEALTFDKVNSLLLSEHKKAITNLKKAHK